MLYGRGPVLFGRNRESRSREAAGRSTIIAPQRNGKRNEYQQKKEFLCFHGPR
jgi:hypothetical protein